MVSLYFCLLCVPFFSDVDITGVDVAAGSLLEVDGFNVAMDDPFSRTRIGNETNLFVDGDGDRSKSSVPGDSDNEQEFNERLVKFSMMCQEVGVIRPGQTILRRWLLTKNFLHC